MQKMTCFESTAIIIVAECENMTLGSRTVCVLLVILLTQLSVFNIPTITKCRPTILTFYENVGPITSVI